MPRSREASNWRTSGDLAWLGGSAVGRVATDGKTARSEIWEPGVGWVPGGNIASVDLAPGVSEARLIELGIPREDWRG